MRSNCACFDWLFNASLRAFKVIPTVVVRAISHLFDHSSTVKRGSGSGDVRRLDLHEEGRRTLRRDCAVVTMSCSRRSTSTDRATAGAGRVSGALSDSWCGADGLDAGSVRRRPRRCTGVGMEATSVRARHTRTSDLCRITMRCCRQRPEGWPPCSLRSLAAASLKAVATERARYTASAPRMLWHYGTYANVGWW